MILEELQEKIYPAETNPSAGDVIYVEGIEITVKQSYTGNWYKAEKTGGETVLYSKGNWGLWKNTPQSSLLPRILACSENEIIIAGDNECNKYEFKVHYKKEDVNLIINSLIEIAKMVSDFTAHGISILYINPNSLYLCGGKIKLNLLPELYEINQKMFSSKDLVAPEVFRHDLATGKESVYVLGILAVKLFKGETINPYEISADIANYIPNIAVPGIPQFLARTFTNSEFRWTPAEALDYLKSIMIERETPIKFDIGMSSSVGLNEERRIDEDSCGFVVENVLNSTGRSLLLKACLADGMGGMAAGEVASKAAVEGFLKSEVDQSKEISDLTLDLAWKANDNVFRYLDGKDGGCTFIGVVLKNETFAVAHVGDSRVYLWKGSESELICLTKDHSYVAFMVSSGNMTEEEAMYSSDRNKILKSLGSIRNRQESYIDDLQKTTGKTTGNLEKGDMLILVCDGIWSEIDDEHIKKILNDGYTSYSIADCNFDSQYIAEALVDAAIKNGGRDNASVLVIKRIS